MERRGGLIRPDDKLRQRVDAAVVSLLADGTIARIYARYGRSEAGPMIRDAAL